MDGLKTFVERLGRPAVLAHRGASRAAPENSLRALSAAVALGADGVEFDVQRCGSGELVVHHDRSLARVTGRVELVPDASLATIRGLTLDRVDADGDGERVPTLEAWLAAAPATLFLNLEAKADTAADARTGGLAASALAAAGRHGAVVSSFHLGALWSSRRSSPAVPRGLLVHAAAGWQARLVAGLATTPQSLHVQSDLATAPRVRLWKRLGLAVAVWTVDAPAEMRRCLACGVDALITNVPDVARDVVLRG